MATVSSVHSAARRNAGRLAIMIAVLITSVPAAVRGDDALDGGVSIIPKDAAFVTATLRLKEQVDLLLGSNAVASLRKLPAVAQALNQIEEQKLQPGSPLSMLDTYLQLPENQQAVELLRDMVSTDTFLYGEPSCITFVELIQKVNQAQNAANILQMSRGGATGDLDVEIDFDGPGNDDDDDDDADDDDGSSIDRRMSIVPVRRQVAEVEEFELRRVGQDNPLTARLIVQALADNSEKIVVPDLVWGFKTGKLEIAASQLKRIEVLLKLVTQTNPAFADALKRRKIGGGEVVTLSLDGAIVPWGDLLKDQEGLDEKDTEKVRQALRGLDLVIAIGIIGDRVVLSIGDSADHLEKLVAPAGGGEGLAATKPFEPLRRHKDKRITSIAYLSEALAKAVAPSAADLKQLAGLTDTLADAAELPDGAAREARELLEEIAAGYERRLPVPGPALSYSFLSDGGYEGYSWDWSRNGVLDGSKRLDLLDHTGGAPIASLVLRTKTHPDQFDDFVSWGRKAWDFGTRYLLPKADEDSRERFEQTTKQLSPFAERLVTTLRTKLLPAVADGQIGFVIDSKGKAARLQRDLPASSEPLPLVEPAVALKLDDPKLFREGLSDLFALADDLVDQVRSLNPGSVPDDYRVPEPTKSKVDGGALWTFALSGSGIDEQIQPTIGIGDDAAVFSLVPRQAGRILLKGRQETGAKLGRFDEPLAGSAALDFAGLIDVIEPWVGYLARVGIIQQRNGFLDNTATIGPDGDDDQVKEGLRHAAVIFDALRCIRLAVAETETRSDATVTHWRNVIRDLPAER